MNKKKAVLYINQFFGQLGGEEMADVAPELRTGLVGPGLVYQNMLGDQVEITHTIICGDNYMGSATEKAVEEIIEMLKGIEFDIFFAGPSFNSGRYGNACANMGKRVGQVFDVPVITSMNEESPASTMFCQDMFIFRGGKSARDMRKDVSKICNFALRYLNGEEMGSAAEEGYFGRGIRKQVFVDRLAGDRAVDMLLKALNGEPVVTEVPMLMDEAPAPAPAVKDLSKATIALVTTGGLVPADNPDGVQSSSASVWSKCDITGLDRLPANDYICIHGGVDTSYGNNNPNVIVPVDVMRAMEAEGVFGKLHNYYYVTTGSLTAESAATRMGAEIAADLYDAGVDAVIFGSL